MRTKHVGSTSVEGLAAKLYPKDIDRYIEYKSPIIEEMYSLMRIYDFVLILKYQKTRNIRIKNSEKINKKCVFITILNDINYC